MDAFFLIKLTIQVVTIKATIPMAELNITSPTMISPHLMSYI